MKLRKINRVIHRDLSYFFAGMVIIYSISGIALNHIHQWNSNYFINQHTFQVELPADTSRISTTLLNRLIENQCDEEILSYYYPNSTKLKGFVKNGTVTITLSSGEVSVETIKRRPFFSQINFLHYNTARAWWTIFSDIFAVSLIVITVTGLFIVKGKNGIKRRGALLIVAGLLLPILALVLLF
ncbi:MAG: PepSY-associated TM helix domain-containing protein [Bacteroidales bacterium]|nr:PepSY-associated TM helix domain-containing protein [Bacteroidales bacterium]MDD4671309.1 PepSY-associated TM helix domain-containing protein [Bacteroidales bacterium]MDY0349603.1 PepSY-associated TM helix domain-containing protein [Tenuifilaceae bacterium]